MENNQQITIDDVRFYNTKTMVDSDGNLTPIESENDVPFAIQRIFYVFGVKDSSTRGRHAHHKTQQVLICINGKIEVTCKDGTREKRFLLESPQQALYVPEMIWDEQIYMSEESILLSVCSTKHDPEDYIHAYEEFQYLKSQPSA